MNTNLDATYIFSRKKDGLYRPFTKLPPQDCTVKLNDIYDFSADAKMGTQGIVLKEHRSACDGAVITLKFMFSSKELLDKFTENHVKFFPFLK